MSETSSKKKLAIITGNRPQYIKCSKLVPALEEFFDVTYIDTGTHYDYKMAEVFFSDVSKPDYNLGIKSGTHADQTGRIMIALEPVLLKETPDMVIVIGDTNTTLAGALVASKLNIKLMHIEAGLRSGDKTMPEEVNRVVTDHLSDYLLTPTQVANDNLHREGLQGMNVGDLMVDLIEGVIEPSGYVLATIHRASNTDSEEKLTEIINYLKKLDKKVIFPIHPRTKKMIEEFAIDMTGINVTDPVGFDEMLELECKADLIVTDSGGVQREAYILGVPFIIMRDTNEWEELKGGKPGLLGEDTTIKTVKVIRNILDV